MAYATALDLTAAFTEREIAQLTDVDGLVGALVPAKAEAALADAESLINSYLAKRYALPLSPVPPLARRWACDLARWFLQPHSAPDQVKANYERVLAELREAAQGELQLPAEAVDGQPFSGAAMMAAPKRTFGAGDLEGF